MQPFKDLLVSVNVPTSHAEPIAQTYTSRFHISNYGRIERLTNI